MFKSRRLRYTAATGLLVLFVLAAAGCAESSIKSAGDEQLEIVPAETLFCVRVNNFDYTLSTIDQFLAGVSPTPMTVSMLVRGQLAKVLGSAELNGVNMGGSFAIFAVTVPGESTESNPIANIFLGGLVPVTDYKQLISGNPNVGQPDGNGVSKITSKGMPTMLARQVGNYALLSSADKYDQLLTVAKSVSAKSAGLAGALDAAEVEKAMKEPLWAYGNVQQASEIFAPLVLGQIEEMKRAMEKMQSSGQGPMGSPAAIMDMYAGILETLMKETKSLSVTVRPKPNVLNITETISAVPETDMANMFVADASAAEENKLLGYLEDGAMMNFAGKMNTPFWKKLNIKSIDLFAAFAGKSMPAEDMAKMKALAEDMISTLSGPAAFSFSIDAKSKPPFALKYVIAVKDADKFNKVIEEAGKMCNTGGIADFYRDLGMETSFTTKRDIDRYEGVSIDSARYVMKSTEPNSPQGQIINAMYGGGLDYRWAMVEGLFVCTICGDVDSAIRNLIDEVKAGGPKQLADEMKAALALLPEAGKADFVATYNFLHWFKMAAAFTPVPIPQMDIPTKSNIVFACKVGGGKMVIDIALPKEHLIEIMAAFLMMQQEMIKQQQPTANLRQLGLALIMYADDHQGKFPADLQQLTPYLGNIGGNKLLESPRKPKGFDGPSYIYVSGQNTGMHPGNIIAYENPAFCSDNIGVLFLDFHVEAMKPAEFLKKLEATYKRLGREMPEAKFKGQ